MLALTWTALGIMAAFSFGVLALHASLNARIDTLHARIDRSDAERREEIRALWDRLDRSDAERREEIQALGDRLERRIDEHETRRHAG